MLLKYYVIRSMISPQGKMREYMWKTSGISLRVLPLSGLLYASICFVYHRRTKNYKRSCERCRHRLRRLWRGKGVYRVAPAMGKTGESHGIQFGAQCASLPYSLEVHANCLKSARCLGCSRLLTIATLALMLAVRTMIELVIDLSSVFAAKTEITSNLL